MTRVQDFLASSTIITAWQRIFTYFIRSYFESV